MKRTPQTMRVSASAERDADPKERKGAKEKKKCFLVIGGQIFICGRIAIVSL